MEKQIHLQPNEMRKPHCSFQQQSKKFRIYVNEVCDREAHLHAEKDEGFKISEVSLTK